MVARLSFIKNIHQNNETVLCFYSVKVQPQQMQKHIFAPITFCQGVQVHVVHNMYI